MQNVLSLKLRIAEVHVCAPTAILMLSPSILLRMLVRTKAGLTVYPYNWPARPCPSGGGNLPVQEDKRL